MHLGQRLNSRTSPSEAASEPEGFTGWLAGHVDRTAVLAFRLAVHLGIDHPEQVRRGALLHDLGKTLLPQRLLNKRGSLNPSELRLVQTHPEVGFRLASRLPRVGRAALEAILYHHERLDGSGYPYGLPANAIPLSAQIVAVADVWDALVSPRPYKPAWPLEKARRELEAQAGIKLNAHLVQTFLTLVVPSTYPANTS